MSFLTAEIDRIGVGLPLVYLLLFFGATALMIWRTETMMERGLEGTALGTLIMPYSSGLGNLIFVFVVASQRHGGREVVVNCLVNNVTNLTLLIGIPAAIWGLTVVDGKRRRIREKGAQQINRLSLLLTAMAVVVGSSDRTGTALARWRLPATATSHPAAVRRNRRRRERGNRTGTACSSLRTSATSPSLAPTPPATSRLRARSPNSP